MLADCYCAVVLRSILSPRPPLINEVASQVMLIDLPSPPPSPPPPPHHPFCFLPLFSKVQLHSSTAIHHRNEAGCGAKLNVPISISWWEAVGGTEVTVVEIGWRRGGGGGGLGAWSKIGVVLLEGLGLGGAGKRFCLRWMLRSSCCAQQHSCLEMSTPCFVYFWIFFEQVLKKRIEVVAAPEMSFELVLEWLVLLWEGWWHHEMGKGSPHAEFIFYLGEALFTGVSIKLIIAFTSAQKSPPILCHTDFVVHGGAFCTCTQSLENLFWLRATTCKLF